MTLDDLTQAGSKKDVDPTAAGPVSDTRDNWPVWRQRLARGLESKRCDALIAIVIAFNIVMICVEVDGNANCDSEDYCAGDWLRVLNVAFTCFYTVELTMRIAAYQSSFMQDKWNVLDLVIVIASFLEMAVDYINFVADAMGHADFNITVLRVFRVARLLRATRVLQIFPELHAMVLGFSRAMMAMWWGFVMIIGCLLIWSVMAVEVVHPVSRSIFDPEEHCYSAYTTVARSMLTLFQIIVAGDAWGECSMDLILKNNALFLVFAGALVSVQLGSMNLILSVIVDSASQAREEDRLEKQREQRREREQFANALLGLLEQVDADRSGTLSYDELLEGYLHNKQMREVIGFLELGQDDLFLLFDVMDTTRCGVVSYHSFIDLIMRLDREQLQEHLLIARLFQRQEESLQAMLSVKDGVRTHSPGLHRPGGNNSSGNGAAVEPLVQEHTGILLAASDSQPGQQLANGEAQQKTAAEAGSAQEAAEDPNLREPSATTPHAILPRLADRHVLQEEPQSRHEDPQRLDVLDFAQHVGAFHSEFAHMLRQVEGEFEVLARRVQSIAAAPDATDASASEEMKLFSENGEGQKNLSDEDFVGGGLRPLSEPAQSNEDGTTAASTGSRGQGLFGCANICPGSGINNDGAQRIQHLQVSTNVAQEHSGVLSKGGGGSPHFRMHPARNAKDASVSGTDQT
eukprot:CAMPEP_0178456418 /NCGR_PEP_ID=MMETSP0689_2-20121128/46461_1 /TAXON_ID=160604 /ORGANISM="Amphidinium massartii, Strain CS-259" /LENGTH=687 /DNA_ID=CAMNT_0020082577 /DNA_START=12 /DNA_END=2073 /DNA_ORIENTATION=+